MTLDYRNGVSIAEIVVYVPCLAMSLFLVVQHGLGRNSGWYFLTIFCLARIIGPCMQLATISQPDNFSLYIGTTVLQNIGLSPLQLATIALLSRLLESINKTQPTIIPQRVPKLIHLIVIVALITGICGGIQSGNAYGSYPPFYVVFVFPF
jgi:hypothetical protein